MTKFSHLDIPPQWKEYWTAYPHGYTIYEALCAWATKVNQMVDNQNQLNEYMDNFIETFENSLQSEVYTTLQEWRESGFFDVILTQVLADIEADLNARVDVISDHLSNSIDDINEQIEQVVGLVDSRAPLTPSERDTEEIQTRLATGCAQLGPGEFLTGDITLTDKQTLAGAGMATQLRQTPESDCLIKVEGQNVQVKDLEGIGLGPTARPSEVGTGEGIIIDQRYTVRNMFSDLQLQQFPGAGLQVEGTGGGVTGNLVSNYLARYCGIGINIGREAEYHQVVNANVRECHIGCQNNGGNNQFTNCVFSSNNIGFQVVGTGNPNHGHGLAQGCFMKHNDDYSVLVIDNQYQFVFNGCQISANSSGVAVLVKNSNGVLISNARIGAGSIIISDDSTVILEGCLFHTAPTLFAVNGGKIVVENCYLPTGGTIAQSDVITTTNPKMLYLNGTYYSGMADMGNTYSIATHVPTQAKNMHTLINIEDVYTSEGYKCGIASQSKISTAGYSTINVLVNDVYVEDSQHGGLSLALYNSNARAESLSTNRVVQKQWSEGNLITLNISDYQGDYYLALIGYTAVSSVQSVRARVRAMWLE